VNLTSWASFTIPKETDEVSAALLWSPWTGADAKSFDAMTMIMIARSAGLHGRQGVWMRGSWPALRPGIKRGSRVDDADMMVFEISDALLVLRWSLVPQDESKMMGC